MTEVRAPLLLLHGFTGRGRSWNDVIAALAGECSVLAPDLPGHGGVETPATFDDAVDAVAAEAVASGRTGWHVAGYSMGGRVALALLLRHPKMFRSAVLIGASPGLADGDARRQRRADDRRWAERLRRGGMGGFLDAWERVPVLDTGDRVGAPELARRRATRASNSAAGLASAMDVLGLGAMPNLWPRLADITVPALLMAGELDPKFRAIAERMAASMPRSRVEIVAGAGHDLVLEAPRRVAAGILGQLRLLEEEGGNDP